MIISLHNGFGFRIETDDITPARTIAAITQMAVNDNVQIEREIVDGDIFPSLTTLLSHNETFELTSLNLDSVLDVVGVAGQCLRGVNTQSGVELFASKIDPCTPGPNSGAVNIRYRAVPPSATSTVYGLLYPGTLSAQTGQDATMSFVVAPTAPNGGAAIDITNNVTLPAIVDNKARYSIAEKFNFGGVSIPGKTNLSISFGVSTFSEKADDALAPEFVAIEKAEQVITISGPSLEWALGTYIPRQGLNGTHVDSAFYLRRRDPNSATGYALDTDPVHIKFTVAGRAFATQLMSVSGNGRAETAVQIYPERDAAGNVPIIVTTNAQIV